MAEKQKADLCVIGAGPAGLAAAKKAVALGAKTILIESGEIGGVSVNWGTLPAQALAHTAERAYQIASARNLGLGQLEARVNFARINAYIRDVVADARVDISAEQIEGSTIELVRGKAKFVARDAIEVEGRTISAKSFIIATGSRPLVPDIPGIDTVSYYTPETIFEISRKPSHLLVVGGGATGLALAQSHLRLGSKVTVVDMVEPLTGFDRELAGAVLRRLEAEGLEILSHTGVAAIAAQGEEIVVDLKSGPEESRRVVSHVVFATGRTPLLDELNLPAAKVQFSGSQPLLGAGGKTSNARLRIVGDAAGSASAHAALYSAEMATASLLGKAHRETIVPEVVHTRPALVQIGLTETRARGKWGDAIAVTRAGFAQTDAARASTEPHGHIKMVTRPGGTIVGIGIVGPAATELAPLFALAIGLKLTPHDLAGTLAPHPTFGEAALLLVGNYERHHPQRRATGMAGLLKRLLP